MSTNQLTAQLRKDFGKGFARRSRAAGRVPAVIYSSHLEAPIHVSVDSHAMFMILKSSANAIINLDVEGEEHLVLVKEVQRHPVTRILQHVDLQAINRNEKVHVEVPVVTVGESVSGTVVSVETMHLAVSAPAFKIPEQIEVSVEGLEDGAVVRLADITLPEGTETEIDGEEVLVTVAVPQVELPEEGESEGESADSEETGSEE